MEFRFDDDQLAVRNAVRAYCDGQLHQVAIANREGRAAEPAWWQGLADLGVLGMLTPASGLGMVEASLVFEELGAHLVSGPVLWSVLAASLLAGVANGGVRVAGLDRNGDGGPIVIEHVAECDQLIVLGGRGVELVGPADLVDRSEGVPFDPLTPCGVVASLPPGTQIGGPALSEELRRRGTILAAALLVGTARGSLDVASAYALEREQFGVPIGSFQAVKHMLADMFVRVELAQAATYAAGAVEAGHGTGDPDESAHVAKLLAGEGAIANARSAIQVLGGMGFTWEMLPHYYLKRAWVLENSFGTSDAHAHQLASVVAQQVQEG